MKISQLNNQFNLLIVDDHNLTCLSLKLLFNTQKHINVVGIGKNGLEAIELVKLYSPEVIILDLEMPLMNGLRAASEIKKITPENQIIAYSSRLETMGEVRVKTIPIDYFCRKDIDSETLIKLVNQLGKKVLNNRLIFNQK